MIIKERNYKEKKLGEYSIDTVTTPSIDKNP